MPAIIRFRPVILGDGPGQVYYLAQRPDGRTYFRDADWAWSVEKSLDAVTASDLPEFYQRLGHLIRILSTREAKGMTLLEADADLTRQIEAIRTGKAQKTRLIEAATGL